MNATPVLNSSVVSHLIERNAIPRDLDFQHQAALLLASPTSASSMMRVQPYCHEESRFTTRRFRIASHWIKGECKSVEALDAPLGMNSNSCRARRVSSDATKVCVSVLARHTRSGGTMRRVFYLRWWGNTVRFTSRKRMRICLWLDSTP